MSAVRSARDAEADAILAGMTEAQLRAGLERARRNLAVIDALEQSEDFHIGEEGHVSREAAITARCWPVSAGYRT